MIFITPRGVTKRLVTPLTVSVAPEPTATGAVKRVSFPLKYHILRSAS